MSPRTTTLRVLVLGAALATSACPSSPTPRAAAHVVALEGKTMGTTYHVKVTVPDAATSARVTALHAEIDRALEAVNDAMSTYRPESEISRFNRHASTEPFPVSPEFARVTRRAVEIAGLTQGVFDVTLGPLIELWGFDKAGRRTEPPSDELQRAARARVGLERLVVEERALGKKVPDLEINLSGIAKGWGVDVVHDLLVARGHADFMVEIGGEVRTRGQNADGRAWRIGINVPRSDADPTAVFRAIALDDAALATSGSYRNYFEAGGARYSHIFDPRTGVPIATPVVSASIVAKDCTTADGLATAAMILGPDGIKPALDAIPGSAALFILEEQHDGGAARLRVVVVGPFPAATDDGP